MIKARVYFDKQLKKMGKHLKAYDKHGRQDDLHGFRVQVKKIRALLVLEESAKRTPALRRKLKPLRRIFRHAGEIRDAALRDEYLKTDEQHVQEHAFRFRSKIKKHRRTVKKSAGIRFHLSPMNPVHVSLYYDHQLTELGELLQTFKKDEELHTCRKRLKILLYNMALVKNAIPGLNENYLEEVQVTIGDWHDKVVALTWLDNGAGVSSVKKERDKLKRRVRQLTTDFYQKATTATELPLPQID